MAEGDSIHPDKRYGWWSEDHRTVTNRLLVYMTKDGQEVTLTGVTSNPSSKGYGWNDAEERGELSHLVRVVQLNEPKPAPTSRLHKVRKRPQTNTSG